MGIYDVIHTPWGDIPNTPSYAAGGMTQQDVYAAQAASGMIQGQTLLPKLNSEYSIIPNTFDVYQDNSLVNRSQIINQSANPIVPQNTTIPTETNNINVVGARNETYIGAGSMTYNGNYNNLGLTTGSSLTGGLTDLFKLTNSGLGLNLPTIALVYGGYRLMKYKKRAGILGFGSLLYGLYGTGILGSLFPKSQTGTQNATNVIMGLAAPQLALASVWGIGVPLIASLIKMGVSRSSSRRRTWYRRPYYVNRRSYRMR